MNARRRLRRIPLPVIGIAVLWILFSGIFLLLSVDEYYAARHRAEQVAAQRKELSERERTKPAMSLAELHGLQSEIVRVSRLAAATRKVADDASGTVRLWIILMIVPLVLGGFSWIAYSLAVPERGVDMSWD